MNVHQNARLTVSCRVLLVERILGGRERSQVAQELGVSVKTAAKWLRRYRDEGVGGLKDRASRPHRMPKATAEVLKVAVLALRRQRLTLATIAAQLRLSRSSVARIAKAGGLSRLSRLEPAPVYRRYERAEPGELLHLDVKKLGRIVRVGHRITGDWRHRDRTAGWEYLHVAIDDASRVAYAQMLPDESNEAAISFLRAAVAYYAGLGVHIKGIYTDNGSCYRSSAFDAELVAAAVVHTRTKPFCPQTNGKIERFNRTLLNEWAYARPYRSEAARTRALDTWLHMYNHHRHHTAIGGPPVSRVNNLVGQNI